MDYTRSALVRSKSISELMFEQDRTFREAVSDKFKARAMGFKEKFTPMNFVRMLTGSGTIGRSIRTVAGRAMNYSERDIERFGGYKRKRSIYGPDRSRVPSGAKTPVKVGDSTADILAKMYNLMRKIDEDNTRRYEEENNFTEENQLEGKKRHGKLLEALGMKKKDTATPKTYSPEKPKEQEDNTTGILSKILGSISGVLGGIFGIFGKISKFFAFIGGTILDALKSISVIGKLVGAIQSILKGLFSGGQLLFTLARGVFSLLLTPIGMIVASLVGIFAQSSDRAKAFMSAETTLPGREFIQYDKDTGKEIGRTIGKGTPEKRTQSQWEEEKKSMLPSAYEAIQKGNKKLYTLPLLGTYGRTIDVALTDEEAKELGYHYGILQSLDKKYELAKNEKNAGEMTRIATRSSEVELELNEKLWTALTNTKKHPA